MQNAPGSGIISCLAGNSVELSRTRPDKHDLWLPLLVPAHLGVVREETDEAGDVDILSDGSEDVGRGADGGTAELGEEDGWE